MTSLLLPCLSSDDEKDDAIDDESSDDEMDQTFAYGGILGEDGGASSASLLQLSAVTPGWSYQDALNKIQKEKSLSAVPRMDVASLIAAKRKIVQSATKISDKEETGLTEGVESDASGDHGSSTDSSSSDSEDADDLPDDDDDEDMNEVEDIIKTRAGKENADDDHTVSVTEEAAKAAAFFDDDPSREAPAIDAFHQLALSRPILRGVAAMGFVKPTPIQSAVIPLALAGRDICASACTGSGKSAAFLLPTLERLLHRPSNSTKALILTPTRELAAQCLGMMTTLAQFTKLRASLIVGGTKNVNSQAAELKSRPDVIVATPGRLLDHLTNSAGVTLTELDILILDEADRLLDLGFQDEVRELIKQCPVQRQTLLFSATMNTKVDDLISLSLKRPVRVRVTDLQTRNDLEVAPRLEQEFVRVRSGNEGENREAMLLALLTRTYTNHVIVFFDTKNTAHRIMILCGLMGIKCAELHGNLTQQQRLQALEDFQANKVNVLLATDLASRGLDIDRVKAVINFEMPNHQTTYVHRVGRTARAQRQGKSCTLIGEGRRHLMKELIKEAETKKKSATNNTDARSGVIRTRTIPQAVVSHMAAKIQSLRPHVKEILEAEAVARMDRVADMEAVKALNIIEHSSEIQSRPQKEWFMSNKDKKLSKEAIAEKQKIIAEKVGTGTHRMTRKKRRAREALRGLESHGRCDDDGDESDKGNASSNKQTVNLERQIKSAVKKKKKADQEKERETSQKSVHDIDTEKVQRAAKKQKKSGKDAVGDSGLFADEKVAFSSRKKEATPVAKSSFEFRGYDPSQKFGKKKGVHKFKSKSKYKRK